jgi:hypothetical protein
LISELLELKKYAILIPSFDIGNESDIHRSAEQQKNADIALKLSTGIRLWDGQSIEDLQKNIEILTENKPVIVNWNSGNAILEEALIC